MKTFRGSCHCGDVQFEADIDVGAETGRCNCSICLKRRAWNIILKPHQFRLIQGADCLSDYSFGARSGHNYFCRQCGCAPFSEGHVEQLGGDIVVVRPNCFDNISDEELAAFKIIYGNGRDNLWWESPKVTSFL